MERKILVRNFRKFRYNSPGFPFFLKHLENGVPFVLRNFRKFEPEFFIQWKASDDSLLRSGAPVEVYNQKF